MSDVAVLRDGWDTAARQNAMHNILSDRVEWEPGDFFERGRQEIARVIERLDGLGLRNKRVRALDFGCGIGRLTQALADHYDRVVGVDVSPEMLKLARAHNQHGRRCGYRLNGPSLSKFDDGSFDLVYSMIVLQHMPPALAKRYVQEFVRVLTPKGVAVFELPEGPDYEHPDQWLSMRGTARAEVERWVTDAGGAVVDVETLNVDTWHAHRYAAVRA